MKNKQALALLFTANSISGFAQGISMLAIPWYFTEIAEKPSLFGKIYAITTLLSLLWTAVAGTLIDRYPRKNLFLSLNVMGFLLLNTIAFIGFQQGGLSTVLVATVFVFTIFNFQLHYPTLYAFGQEMTESKNYGKVNSLLETLGQTTAIIAGGMAAILLSGLHKKITLWGEVSLNIEIDPWPIHQIFLADGITYGMALLLVFFIRYEKTDKLSIDKSPFLKRLKTGFQFLNTNKRLFWFGVATHSVFVIALVNMHLLQPVYVKQILNDPASSFAIAKVFYSLGALSAGLFIRRIFRKTSTVKAILVLMVFITIGFSSLHWNTALGLFLLVSFVIGISNAGTRILRVTYLFEHIKNNIIGRANSIFQLINIALRFSFITLFGLPFFLEEGRVEITYFIGGSFILLSTLPLLYFYKSLVKLKTKDL